MAPQHRPRHSPQHIEDYRALAVIALTLALQAWTLATTPSWVSVALQGWLSFVCCVINHNHTHRGTFASERANDLTSILLTLARGHSSAIVIVPHNLNHHVHAAQAGDWSRPELAGSGWGIARVLRYLYASTMEMARERRSAHAPRLSTKAEAKLKIEQACLRAMIAFGLVYDWKALLLYWALPWFLAIEALLVVNLLQHDGCDPSREQSASRNFVGRLANWLLFNAGFHTAHHARPTAHWTELPAIHARLGIPRELDEPSILVFFFRSYVLGGSEGEERVRVQLR